MLSTIKILFRKSYATLLPYHCIFCQSLCDERRDICRHCQQQLSPIKQACQRCKNPLKSSNMRAICGQCLKKPPLYDELVVPFYYDDLMASLICQLKFGKKLAISRVLAELFIDSLSHTPSGGLIIPVPLHLKRQRKRGFNQSLEIARFLSQALKLPIDPNACKRTRYTLAQAELPAKARHANVNKAFWASPELCNQSVIIVDDVLTTGSTINAICKTLRTCGVKHITVWAMAKTK
jgi:ComF family protein